MGISTDRLLFRAGCSGGEGVRQVGIWGKGVLGRGNGQCKGPGGGMCLVYLRSCEEASVAGAE